MDTDIIREILFLKAKEYKTIDLLIIAEINAEIELTKNIVPIGLGVNYNLGVALLTAHNMKMSSASFDGYSGLITSEEIDDRKITYSDTSKPNINPLFKTAYGEQYQQLLDLIIDHDKKPNFYGYVV